MAQRNVTTSGSYLAKALVSPTGGAADETLADIAQAAISVASTDTCGRVELATADETAAGMDATRAVTPAGLAAQSYIRSTDVTYKALNDNGCVGTGASQVARGDHGHTNASSSTSGFMSAADKSKLDSIETEATADQTGAEIVAAIDSELGGTDWKQGSVRPHTHSAEDLPDRGAFYGKSLGPSLAECGGVVDINIPGLPAKATAGAADLVPIWDAEAAAHRHVPVAGLRAGRGIIAPPGEDPAISMELPAAVDRRDFLLGFTATGAVTTTKVATAADVDELAARGMRTVENIAALRQARPRLPGAAIYVKGHSSPGDGGEGVFRWEHNDNRQMVTAATIANGGSGYYLYSEIWTASGTGTHARWLVSAVNESGAVTCIELLDPGKYTANPKLVAASTNVMGTGSGCTLDLTMGPLDNGGTIVASNAGGPGRWLRDYSGPVNVRWFGAKDGAAEDARAAFQAAIAAFSQPEPSMASQPHYGPVFVPPGRYLITKSIVLQNGTRLFGASHRTCVLVGRAGLTEPIIRTNAKTTEPQRNACNWTMRKRVKIENLMFAGSCEHAVQLCYNTESELRDIYVRCSTSSHGIYIEDCWNTEVWNVKTTGANINANSACLFSGRDNNAFNVMKFETSNACAFGIYHWGNNSGKDVAGQVVAYRDCTLQGHNDTGLYVVSNGYGGLLIENTYTEGCRQAISLGEEEGAKVVRGVCINGGNLSGVSGKAGKAVLCLWRVDGCSVNGVIFGLGGCQALIGLGLVRRTSITGCSAGFNTNWLWNPATGGPADSQIKSFQVNSSGYTRKPQGFFLQDDFCGTTKPYGGTVLVMSGNSPSGSSSRRLVKMSLNDDQDPPVWVMERFVLPSIPF